jgi:hypothetical protein
MGRKTIASDVPAGLELRIRGTEVTASPFRSCEFAASVEGGRGSCFPTHDAIRLRHGWGIQISGDGEHQFAEVGGGFQAAEGFAGFGPGAAFEDGVQLCGGDCIVHFFEVVAGADVDSLDADLLV